MISARIRAMGAAHWLLLYAFVLIGWVVLWLMSLSVDPQGYGAIYGADFLISLCTTTPDASGFFKLFLMWSLMSAAMMLPTALPAFAAYEDLGHSTDIRFPRLVAGYFAVWLGFSALAAIAQLGLFQMGAIDGFGASLSVWFSASLLLLAGFYQFSSLKEACLSKCRMPLTFFMQHWDDGPVRMGLRLGAVCLGCCWALMLLAFVGGTMSLGFMALATVLMMTEKLPDIGKYITAPLGGALIGSAVLVAASGYI